MPDNVKTEVGSMSANGESGEETRSAWFKANTDLIRRRLRRNSRGFTLMLADYSREMRYVPVLFLLLRCAMAANPDFNFTFDAGATCTGICLSGATQINALAIDAQGNTYVTGNVNATTLPTTPGVLQPSLSPGDCAVPFSIYVCSDAFVVKLDPAGNVVWATYLGGNGDDHGSAIAVDAEGDVFVAGYTAPGGGQGNTFPITPQAAFGALNPFDSATFVSKLSADGSRLLYSTFLPGGTNGVTALAVDPAGNAYIAIQSNPAHIIPTTPGAFQPTAPPNPGGPAAVMKLNAAGSALIYATYLAGSGVHTQDFPMSIAVDGGGNAVVAGFTGSVAFPVTPGAFQTTTNDRESSPFVAKLNAYGTALIYSTYLGGSKTDQASVVKLDSSGHAYVFGTAYSPDFPVTSGTFPAGTSSGFVTELSSDGSQLIYSIFVPNGTSMDLDRVGNVYVAGRNPKAVSAAFTAFVERLAPGGVSSGMDMLGGHGVLNDGTQASDSANLIAVAPNGSVAIAGTAVSTDFPGIPAAMTADGLAYVASLFINATVMSAANYTAGVVAPGEIIAIRGDGFDQGRGQTMSPGPNGLLPTSFDQIGWVKFDEFFAPLIYVQSQQINAQVPWEIAGRNSVQMSIQVVLKVPILAAGPITVAVAPSVPGVFYVNNSDGTTNSPANPATRGDFVSLYGTGGGLTSPVGITGGFWPLSPLASLTLPVTITIGGESANLIYSGSAPTLLTGFFQINVRIPADLATSGATPMTVNIGGGSTTVAVAIR